MKIRAVVILVGLAISFALPAFAQEKEGANPVKSASFQRPTLIKGHVGWSDFPELAVEICQEFFRKARADSACEDKPVWAHADSEKARIGTRCLVRVRQKP